MGLDTETGLLYVLLSYFVDGFEVVAAPPGSSRPYSGSPAA